MIRLPDSIHKLPPARPKSTEIQLHLHQIQTQLELAKKLLQRNLEYQARLVELRDKAMVGIKNNEVIEKSIRKPKKKTWADNKPIVGVSFYNYENQRQSETLTFYRNINTVKPRDNLFLRTVLENVEVQGDYHKRFVDMDRPLEEIVHTYPRTPQLIPFYEIGVFYSKTGLEVYQIYKKALFPIAKLSHFTAQEDELVQKYFRVYGDNWLQISMLVEGKSPNDIYYRFHKKLNSLIETGRWKQSEKVKLIILAEYFGKGKWACISKKFMTRTDVQIREEFCNVLDPNLTRNIWTEEEEQKLFQIAHKYDYKWSTICKQFESKKSDSEVRRKFRDALYQKSEEEIREIVKKPKLLASILNYRNVMIDKRKKAETSERESVASKQQEKEGRRKRLKKKTECEGSFKVEQTEQENIPQQSSMGLQ